MSIVSAGWRCCRRKPVVALLLVALFVSLVSGLAAVTWQWRKAEENRQRATANYQHARRVVAEFFEKLSHDDMFNDPAVQPARLALLGIAARHYHEFVREHGHDSELEASLAEASYRTAFITSTIGSHNDALALYRESVPRWERLVKNNPQSAEPLYFLAKTHDHIGTLLGSRGWAEAAEAHRRALEIRQDLVRRDPNNIAFQHDLANSYRLMGGIYRHRGDHPAARLAYDRARLILESLVNQPQHQAPIRRSLGDLHLRVGGQYRHERKYQESLNHLEQARAMFAALVDEGLEAPSSSIALAEARFELARTYRLSERPAEARKMLELARDLQEQLAAAFPDLTSISIDLARSCMSLGSLCLQERRWDESVENYERALDIRKALAEKYPSTLKFQTELADAYFRLAESRRHSDAPEQALAAYQEAYRLTSWLHREKNRPELAKRLADIEERLSKTSRADGKPLAQVGFPTIER